MSDKRQSLSRAKRFRVMARDNFRCIYCGATPDKSELHIDHLLPVNSGGTDDFNNLVTACADCNLGKRDAIISEMVDRGLQRGAAVALQQIYDIANDFRAQVSRHIAQVCWQYAQTGDRLHFYELNRPAEMEMEYDMQREAAQ